MSNVLRSAGHTVGALLSADDEPLMAAPQPSRHGFDAMPPASGRHVIWKPQFIDSIRILLHANCSICSVIGRRIMVHEAFL